MRSVPLTWLASNASIDSTYTFTALGTAGGGNTSPETGVVFTFTAGSATSDPDTNDNTLTSATVPLVDALDDAATFAAGTVGATFDVGANDRYGTGALPWNASFRVLGGTTCTGASFSGFGVVTFDVPASGSCVVAYEVCVGEACDTAKLSVRALAPGVPIPSLGRWALVVLVVGLSLLAIGRLRRMGV